LYGGNPAMTGEAPTKTAAAPNAPATPAAPAAPTAPAAPNPNLVGVGYDKDSQNKAANEVLYGPSSGGDLAQSQAYQKNTTEASARAQASSPYTRTLASVVAANSGNYGLNTPGAGASYRAAMVNTLNTLSRTFGGSGTYFGENDQGQVLANKVASLQAGMRAAGADEHSLGALEIFKGANASLDQPPAAAAEISARLMTDEMRAQDREAHMYQYKNDSPMKTVLGAQTDFNAKNGPEKYDKETQELKQLMLGPYRKVFVAMNNGSATPAQIQEALQHYNLDPNLIRYFARGKPSGQQ
jgi:hypothetical protein